MPAEVVCPLVLHGREGQRLVDVGALVVVAELLVVQVLELEAAQEVAIWGQCYKTFYGRTLCIFIISQSVCPWQAFPAKSIVCG